MTRILVVDDEPQILRTLRITLRAHDYEVDTAANGHAALDAFAAGHPDLVVLDLGLPDMDGVDVIRGLRGAGNAPIIVLSGRIGSAQKVAALDAGADDYVNKPFGVDELLARIRAATRRATATTAALTAVRIGRHTLNLADRLIHTTNGPPPRLTPTEWQLLDILTHRPGKLVSQRDLLAQVWGPAHTGETHYLRQYLAQLRRKLEDDPAHPRQLITEPGMGYRFQPHHDNATGTHAS